LVFCGKRRGVLVQNVALILWKKELFGCQAAQIRRASFYLRQLPLNGRKRA